MGGDELGLVEVPHGVAGLGEGGHQFGGRGVERGRDLPRRDPQVIERHTVEALGVLADGRVATVANVGHDGLDRSDRACAAGVGPRQAGDEVGDAAKVETVQHEPQRYCRACSGRSGVARGVATTSRRSLRCACGR